MYEYVGNLHVHTTYSDGAQPHDGIAAAAIRAGLDFVVTTDHNVRVSGVEGYYRSQDGRQVLLLVGEEVHDMLRQQFNHLLVYGTGEMATCVQGRPAQAWLDAVRQAGGWAFLAHPTDRAVAFVREASYRWEDWTVTGYAGLELWNTMSTVKVLMTDLPSGLRTAYDPAGAIVGPEPETLALWDGLLRQGQRVAVIGCADAHGTDFRKGPLRRTIFPYEFLFRCVNTHVLLESPLMGEWAADGAALYRAIAQGSAFVGYGLPGDPRGFRFTAELRAGEGAPSQAGMGAAVPLGRIAALHVQAPAKARLRLIRDGAVVTETNGDRLTGTPDAPGAYRVEVWKRYRGRERGWIFSNPIYVVAD